MTPARRRTSDHVGGRYNSPVLSKFLDGLTVSIREKREYFNDKAPHFLLDFCMAQRIRFARKHFHSGGTQGR
jgi:hypothetical protein